MKAGARVPRALLVGGLVALSGFCSLNYQVVWERMLRTSFGGDSAAAAVVSGTFVLGLGIGAWLFGRWHRHPFKVYGAIEIGIGAWGALSYWVLGALAPTLNSLFDQTVQQAVGMRSVVIVGAVLFLLPPSILIGGTLPLMFNCFVRQRNLSGKAIGLLYGLNTFGAAIGILAAPYLLLNHLSLFHTLLVISCGNLLIAATLFIWHRQARPAEQAELGSATSLLPPSARIMVAAFASGAVTLSAEVSYFRAFQVQMPSSPYAFPFALLTILLALAAGSFIWTRTMFERGQQGLERIGLLFVAGSAVLLIGIVASTRCCSEDVNLILFGATLAAFPLVMGGVFPLLLRAGTRTHHDLPRQTGLIYLANASGAFIGAAATQFLAFPLIGTPGSVTVSVWVASGVGLVCMAPQFDKRVIAVLGCLCVVAPLLVPTQDWNAYRDGPAVYRVTSGDRPDVTRVEGSTGVTVVRWDDDRSAGDVFVNGQYMGRVPHHPNMIMMGTYALSWPQRSNVLVLGLASGGLIKELSEDPAIQRIDVVDWSGELPAVLSTEAVREVMDGDVLDKPHVTFLRHDARLAVTLYEDDTFDEVIDTLAVAGWVGTTDIKSTQYYAEIRRILKPGGLLVAGGPYTITPRGAAALRSIKESFPYVVLKHEPGYESVSAVTLAAENAIQFTHEQFETTQARRRALRVQVDKGPPIDWFLRLAPVTMQTQLGNWPLAKVDAIRDGVLTQEYRQHPFPRLLHRRRQTKPSD